MSNYPPNQQMQRFLPPLNALKAFESAARLKSLTKAADELNVTRAAVSQQVKQLEQTLSATLFERSGSKLTLTEDAQYYLPLLTQVFDSLSVGTEQLFEKRRRHLVTLSIAQSFCHQWLIPRLAEFKRLHPHIELKITTTSNAYPSANQAADVEIINGVLPLGGDESNCLAQEHWRVVASPGFLKRQPICDLASLAQADKLATTGYRENWRYWFDRLGHSGEMTRPVIQFDHSLLAVEAAVCGLGVLLVKDLLVEDQLKQGELHIVGEWQLASETCHYVLCHNQSNSHALEFAHWLRHSFHS